MHLSDSQPAAQAQYWHEEAGHGSHSCFCCCPSCDVKTSYPDPGNPFFSWARDYKTVASFDEHQRNPRWRIGNHWGLTLIQIGDGPEQGEGRREGDRLAATFFRERDARRVAYLLNFDVTHEDFWGPSAATGE